MGLLPFQHWIDEATNVVTAKLTGEIDAGELLTSLAAMKRDPRLKPDYRSFIDLSEAEPVEIDGEVIRRAAGITPGAGGRSDRARVAILAPSDVSYGLSRMYAMLSEDLERDVQVFREAAAARAWLGIADPEGDLAA